MGRLQRRGGIGRQSGPSPGGSVGGERLMLVGELQAQEQDPRGRAGVIGRPQRAPCLQGPLLLLQPPAYLERHGTLEQERKPSASVQLIITWTSCHCSSSCCTPGIASAIPESPSSGHLSGFGLSLARICASRGRASTAHDPIQPFFKRQGQPALAMPSNSILSFLSGAGQAQCVMLRFSADFAVPSPSRRPRGTSSM